MNPLNHDPNGFNWDNPDARLYLDRMLDQWEEYGYTSYESFIESKAGSCPPPSDWPFPPVDPPGDEDQATPND